MRRSTAMLGLLIGLILPPRPALGDARDAVLMRAVAAKELAIDQPDPARWQEAFDRFLAADSLEASSDIKYELGLIASQLRQDDVAVGYYEDAIALGVEGPARKKALEFINQHGPRMARLDVRGERGIRLRTRGIERDTLPLRRPVVVFAGESRLEVIFPNQRQSSSLLFSLEPGQIKRVLLTPVPNAATTADVSRAAALTTSDPPSDAAHSQKPLLGLWLLGAGAGVAVTSAVLVPISIWRLDTTRGQLANVCNTPSASPDGCQAARLGHYDEARALANDIADWKTVRAIAWAGLGIGVASAISGLLMITTKSIAISQGSNSVVAATMDHRSLLLNLSGSF